MRTVTLGIKKAIQKIRLDDTPGSPEFVLDLTNDEVNRKAVPMAQAWSLYDALVKKMGDGEMDDDIDKRVAAVYRHVITVMLGSDAYQIIRDYVSSGMKVPEHQLTDVLAPLVAYLFGEFGAVITANRNEAVEKYLGAYEPYKA